MAGAGKLVAGILVLIIAGILLVGAAISATTYFGSLDVMEGNKKARDSLKNLGQDTTELDEKIRQDQQLLDNKVMLMSICFPVGAILAILGAALILSWRRNKDKPQPAGFPHAAYLPPGQQYPSQPYPQYPGYQNPPPPQYPGYQPPPPQYPGYQGPPPQYPGYQGPPPPGY